MGQIHAGGEKMSLLFEPGGGGAAATTYVDDPHTTPVGVRTGRGVTRSWAAAAAAGVGCFVLAAFTISYSSPAGTAAISAAALGATAPAAAEDGYTVDTAPQVIMATGTAGGGGGGWAGLGDNPLLGLGGNHSG